ncbi:MAG: cell wall hydrolase [Geminicoccaceae bacterium]
MERPTSRDTDILARTLYGEARGEPWEGIQAVACVVRNRVADRRWPDRIAEVCLQPRQFSCWNRNDANLRAMLLADEQDAGFLRCLEAAEMAINHFVDITHGATHYLNPDVFKKLPAWFDAHKIKCRFGRHVFLAGIA